MSRFPENPHLGVRLGLRQAGPGSRTAAGRSAGSPVTQTRRLLYPSEEEEERPGAVAAWPPRAGSAGGEGGGPAVEAQGGGKKAEGALVMGLPSLCPRVGREPRLVSHPPESAKDPSLASSSSSSSWTAGNGSHGAKAKWLQKSLQYQMRYNLLTSGEGIVVGRGYCLSKHSLCGAEAWGFS